MSLNDSCSRMSPIIAHRQETPELLPKKRPKACNLLKISYMNSSPGVYSHICMYSVHCDCERRYFRGDNFSRIDENGQFHVY